MSTSLESTQAISSTVRAGAASWTKRHPLMAFFILAYGFAWLLWIPLLVLSGNGLGMLPFKAPTLLIEILSGFSPAVAAVVVTGLIEGRAGVAHLLRRCIQWRVGAKWYLTAFLVPILFLAASLLLGAIQPVALLQKWPLLLTFYPLDLLIQAIIGGGLGEEPGWRGFALPRMQSRFGPLPAAILLGLLHACWHIPLFFVPELSQANFSFVLYALVGIAVSIFLAWVYNNTGGALPIMMVLHEAENTTSALSLHLAPEYLDRTPAYLIVFGIVAAIVVLVTRGTLAYKRGGVSQAEQ